jgi:hypothetical protein
MHDPSDDRLDYLLSRGRLSGPQKSRILEQVMRAAGAVPAQRPRRWWAWGGGLGLAVAAAAALLLWIRPAPPAPDFRTKGVGANAVGIELWCLGGELQACPHGSRVAFSVEGGGEGGKDATAFLSAYAVPSFPGERVWYVLNEPLAGTTIRRAVQVGTEHGTGLHRVEVVLARRPLSRPEVLAPTTTDVIARAHFDLRVTP